MNRGENGRKTPSPIVVKVGTSTLTGEDDRIDDAFVERFVDDVAAVRLGGRGVVLVTSGAIRAGVERMNLRGRNLTIPQKQAAAAVGQGLLINKYTTLFARHGIVTSQVLLTRDIVHMRKKYLNARNTLLTLLEYGTVPIVNENDTIACEEIMFGDNDTLSAITALIVDADLLVLLSDVDGLYDREPGGGGDARLIPVVEEITPEIRELAGGPGTDSGSGGMVTKISAAAVASEAGIRMVIANGRTENVVRRIAGGEPLGTTFLPRESRMSSRKKWLAFGPSAEGRVVVNRGARDMIAGKGKSLLPAGIVRVEGEFENGACVEIADEENAVFARGLSNYSSAELATIKGRRSGEIENRLGFTLGDEAVHRDNLVVL
ncbi:MAG: glutamate 5-kinase [bacterium]